MNEFMAYVALCVDKRHPALRCGQNAFNVLSILYPEIANQIRDTRFDPFYNDDRLHVFFTKLIQYFVN